MDLTFYDLGRIEFLLRVAGTGQVPPVWIGIPWIDPWLTRVQIDDNDLGEGEEDPAEVPTPE